MEDKNLFDTNIIEEKNIPQEGKKYLLQINRIKLKDYLNFGLILPDKYLGNDCEKDIQSKNKDFLALSDGFITELNEYQILIEIILKDDEISKLHQSIEIFYLDSPIPITRIKRIYVQDRQTLKHILVSNENSENGVLPKELFDVYKKGKRYIFEEKEYKQLDIEFELIDYTKQVRMYDKRMGMFSFMKNTNLYYADKMDVISNYSENYFTIFSTLLEKSLVDDYYHGLDFLTNYASFKDILFGENQIDKEFLNNFAETIVDQETKELFSTLLKPTGTRELIKEFSLKHDSIYYFISLIWYFRQRNDNNKLENLKSDIINLIPYEKAELSLALLGIYYGYSRLRTYEIIDIENKFFNQIFGKKFNIKFEMNNKLDYVMIETLYQKSFHNKKGYEYEYLEYPKNKLNLKLPIDKNFKIWYKVEKLKYFDIENIKIKKLKSLEMFGQLLGKYSEEILENKQSRYLIPFVQYNFCDILRFNDKGQKYFAKKELLEKLEVIEEEKLKVELIDVLSIGNN